MFTKTTINRTSRYSVSTRRQLIADAHFWRFSDTSVPAGMGEAAAAHRRSIDKSSRSEAHGREHDFRPAQAIIYEPIRQRLHGSPPSTFLICRGIFGVLSFLQIVKYFAGQAHRKIERRSRRRCVSGSSSYGHPTNMAADFVDAPEMTPKKSPSHHIK